MENFGVTLANRKAPWEQTNWMAGRKADATPEDLATAKDMLEAAGLDGWAVDKKPLYVGRKGPLVPGKFATVKADGTVLGVVGRGYKVLQTEEAFGFGDNIVDAGGANWERAGFFRNGSIVFGALELTHLDISVPGDDSAIKPYLLLVNSFDGSTPFQGILAFIRPICVNTFEAARGTETPYRFNIRHTGTLDGKLAMAREALGIAFKHTAEVKELVTSLALKSVVDEQVLDIFRTAVWPIDADAISEGRLEAHASTQAYENYQTSPTIDGIRGTAWGAFNAVTEFVDHVVEYKGKVNVAEDVKGDAILFGRGQMRKDRALKALLALK